MISASRTAFVGMAIWSAAYVACPGCLCAQAPPGPLPPTASQDAAPPAVKAPPGKPEVQPKTSIFGAWKLDTDDSDDPRKKMQDARGSGSSGNNGGYGGGRRMGGGYPGGGYPGRGRSGSRGVNEEDRQGMQELFTPARSLTLAEAQKAEVDAFDDQNRKRAFFTDGRKLQKSKDSNYQEIAAHWDGARLTTDEKSPRGGKLSRTFELSYDGTQLYETLHLTVGRNDTPLVIRYVYDQIPSSAKSAAASSPAPTAKQ
jgi:hypothetical protein